VITASVLEEKEDLAAGMPTYELNMRAASVRARQTDDGQLPLPLFSTIPTTQPPSEGATQLAGDAIAAFSRDFEAPEETEIPIVDSSMHELNALPNKKTVRRMARYHRYQEAFMEEFLFTTVAKCDEYEFWNLFLTGPHQPDGNDGTLITIKKADTLIEAANIVVRDPEFQPSRRLLQHLQSTIRNRQKAQRWFARLHPRDKRCGRVPGHLAFIEILKRVYQTLSGGRAYSPMRQ
jgi:hypothetical protein